MSAETSASQIKKDVHSKVLVPAFVADHGLGG